MAMNGLKTEGDVAIKPDPENGSPSVFADDEDYEDTGELQFPKNTQSGWLTRVPSDLWKALREMNDDDKVEVGKVHVWFGQDNEPQKMRWFLDKNVKSFEMIPKEYDMIIPRKDKVKNMFIFSEKDLPGYRSNRSRLDRLRGNDPLKKTEDGGRIEKPRYRGPRTIPKHTAYTAFADHEVHCNPRETEEYYRIQAMKLSKQQEARVAREEAAGSGRGIANVGIGVNKAAEDFLRITTKPKKRPQDFKAARLDEAVLSDMIIKKFREYRFWSTKRLKQDLQQPETYLKEILSKYCELVKSGPAANNWRLKPEYEPMLNLETVKDEGSVKQEEIAPDASSEGEDFEDEDMEMVDVV